MINCLCKRNNNLLSLIFWENNLLCCPHQRETKLRQRRRNTHAKSSSAPNKPWDAAATTTTKHHHHHNRRRHFYRRRTTSSSRSAPHPPPTPRSRRWIRISRLSYARTLSAPYSRSCRSPTSLAPPASLASGGRWHPIARCRFKLSFRRGSFGRSSENLARAASGGIIPFRNSPSPTAFPAATPSLALLSSIPFRYCMDWMLNLRYYFRELWLCTEPVYILEVIWIIRTHNRLA